MLSNALGHFLNLTNLAAMKNEPGYARLAIAVSLMVTSLFNGVQTLLAYLCCRRCRILFDQFFQGFFRCCLIF